MGNDRGLVIDSKNIYQGGLGFNSRSYIKMLNCQFTRCTIQLLYASRSLDISYTRARVCLDDLPLNVSCGELAYLGYIRVNGKIDIW